MNNNIEHIVIVLPSCIFTKGTNGKKREKDLNKNLTYIQKYFPSQQIIVVDNGHKKPYFPTFVNLIYSPKLKTKNA
jgi:hypothetical protein